MNRKTMKFSIVACLLLLVVAGSGVASAYSISAHADEKQLEIIKEIYGQEMTQGEFWEMVFPDEYNKLKENLSPEEFKEFCSMEKYWGDDHPELPYGANLWDENGPVSLTSITDEEKSKFGLEDLKTDESGYVIQDSGRDVGYLVDRLCALMESRSGLVLYANNLDTDGSSITHSGSGRVAGGSSATTLSLTTELYGDGSLVDSDYHYWGSNGNLPQSITHDFYSPQSGVLYQSKLSGSSSNPSYSGYTWSPGELWPF